MHLLDEFERGRRVNAEPAVDLSFDLCKQDRRVEHRLRLEGFVEAVETTHPRVPLSILD